MHHETVKYILECCYMKKVGSGTLKWALKETQ